MPPAITALESLASSKSSEKLSTEPVAGKKRRKKRALKDNKNIGMQDLFDAVCTENNEQAFPSIAWDFDEVDDLERPPAKKPNSSPSLGLMAKPPSHGKSNSGGRLVGLSRAKSHRSSMSSLGRATSQHFGRII